MPTFIENKRKTLNLSQSQVAQSLGISRPTYTKIEKGEVSPTEKQMILLTQLFKVSPESFTKSMSVGIGLSDSVEVRDIPKENEQKFQQVLLYILAKVGSKPNIGQTALYKLLYFIDFDYYEKFEEQLIGATYIKNKYGPTPVSFAKIVRRMELEGKIVEVKNKFFGRDQTKYIATVDADVSYLSGKELQHIDTELNKLASLTASELLALSHKDTPWVVAQDKEVINYEHVFYRPEETSVREYEPL